MIHEKVDIEYWKSMFSLAEMRKRARDFVMQNQIDKPSLYSSQKAVEKHIQLASPGADMITGPDGIAILELLRDEVLEGMNIEHIGTTPVDVFIFSLGEPERRDITKVGGLPYWPREAQWPNSTDGKPMTFCCQINFTDSKDLVGELPGDILLVFANTEYEGMCIDDLSFQWMNMGMMDLVMQADIPNNGGSFTPCYGSIYRTVDYNRESFSSEISSRLFDIEGIKIGGIPRWVDNCPMQIPGRFLCMMITQGLIFYRKYPWMNVPGPIETMEEMGSYNLLNWGWNGNLYIYIDDHGDINWKIQCY